MKTKAVIIGLTMALAGLSSCAIAPSKVESNMGLSQTSVFDVPTPDTVAYSEIAPGTSVILPRAYAGAPPQIPHNIQGFKPVTAQQNACVSCHDNPALRGQKVKGVPTAIPESHYTDQRNQPGVVGNKLVGGRYICTQCHVPQANAMPLVENSFKTL